MRKTKQESQFERLVGRWRASSGQIAVVFVIERTPKGFRVQAIDESDGEKLLVSKVKWERNNLTFETRTRSNKWRTLNRLRLVSKNKAIQELTYWEPLEKLTDPITS